MTPTAQEFVRAVLSETGMDTASAVTRLEHDAVEAHLATHPFLVDLSSEEAVKELAAALERGFPAGWMRGRFNGVAWEHAASLALTAWRNLRREGK